VANVIYGKFISHLKPTRSCILEEVMLKDEEPSLTPGRSEIFLFFTKSRRAVGLTKLPVERINETLSSVVK
jgi:hypothetical protein